MSNNSLLVSLVDPSVPVDVSYFPHTLGWQVLLVGLASYMLYHCMEWIQRFYRNRHRRAAIRQLEQCKINQTEDVQQILITINTVLKECATRSYPKRNIVHLYGQEWLTFLTATGEGTRFSSHLFSQWQYALYQPKHQATMALTYSNTRRLLASATKWVECHVGEYA